MPSNLRVPRTLNPDRHPSAASRPSLQSSASSTFILLRLPSCLVLSAGRSGAQQAEDEEEIQVQNELVFGFFSMLVMYLLRLWGRSWRRRRCGLSRAIRTPNVRNARSPHGALLWAPKKWNFPLAALAKYKIPVSKESEFISKPTGSAESSLKIPSQFCPPADTRHRPRRAAGADAPEAPPAVAPYHALCPARARGGRAGASRVLRAAARAERAEPDPGRNARQSDLARLYGGIEVAAPKEDGEDATLAGDEQDGDGGREASGVIAF
ncbi:hypothetical protein K438DRAFT_1966393 [Mycena galopus ATCC 62051]|nr:hypothetical protein K438DRAFT_1966393 [Mycena galopus ATCC 62051]